MFGRARRGRYPALAAAALLCTGSLAAQERGANALGEAIQDVGTSARVLMIGAHPDDEDTFLITWLSRGRGIETGYLSLTRGDGGQNLIGNELGEPLGVLRTEELLAARRVDGALQYFSRAYDFGFSKDTIDTYAHWPRDSILGDVIRVVRAFRPHVIVAVFTGTPRDGHGHHQVSGLLARAAYDAAGDIDRYPVNAYGPAWTPLKFYRGARFRPETATLTFDVGEYSPLLGRSYAEIAAESRSKHRSQGFGTPRRLGSFVDMLAREDTRVNAGVPAGEERSIFDGIDTSWTRFHAAAVTSTERAWLDSLPRLFAAARAAFDPREPAGVIDPLVRARGIVRQWMMMSHVTSADLRESLAITARRIDRALRLASGGAIEAVAARELYPAGSTVPVVVSVYNRSLRDTIVAGAATADDGSESAAARGGRSVPPASSVQDTVLVRIDSVDQPWWLRTPRAGAMFTQPASRVSATRLAPEPVIAVTVRVGPAGTPFGLTTPIVFRDLDPASGEVRRPVVAAPAISVTVEQQTQYAPANAEFVRELDVSVRSADPRPRDVRVRLTLPEGLAADSAERTVRTQGYDDARTVTFRLRGRLRPGAHRVAVVAESEGERFASGYQLIDYDHIRRRRIYRPAVTTLSAVDMRVPATLRVAYVPGVGDNVAPTLAQLGIPVTVIPAAEIARADLLPYTTIVIGPRAYEAHPELLTANAQLFDFARRGGTVVVQYGQNEMTRPGAMPFPITLARPADRVTDENAAVTIEAPEQRLLQAPNRIGAADFADWVQERSLYMPRTFDDHYRALMSMHDRGEPPNRGAILVAPLGRGVYVYTTLSFFRQLPAGVPGAARLFVNLLSANLPASVNP